MSHFFSTKFLTYKLKLSKHFFFSFVLFTVTYHHIVSVEFSVVYIISRIPFQKLSIRNPYIITEGIMKRVNKIEMSIYFVCVSVMTHSAMCCCYWCHFVFSYALNLFGLIGTHRESHRIKTKTNYKC